ncbi:MAG: energy transducer TonB [Pseudomonadota bacterium]
MALSSMKIAVLSQRNWEISLTESTYSNIMKNKIAIFSVMTLLSGCAASSFNADSVAAGPTDRVSSSSSSSSSGSVRIETTTGGTSTATTIDTYKKDVAHRISQVNSTKVYTGRPQALLRSIVVLKYTVDGGGNLVRSEIQRSNRDQVTEATALATLRNTAPFPKPASHLLRQGRVELLESWLFNSDGRFQLRSIALPQMNE